MKPNLIDKILFFIAFIMVGPSFLMAGLSLIPFTIYIVNPARISGSNLELLLVIFPISFFILLLSGLIMLYLNIKYSKENLYESRRTTD